MPIDVLLLLYNSLVLPHINYSLLVWGHNPFRITKLKKKCLRIITFSKIFAHCDTIFKNLRLLKTEDIFKIKQLKFYYKYVKNNLPLYFQNLSIKANNHTHNTRNQDLYKCRIKHDFAKQSLLFSIPETINNCCYIVFYPAGTGRWPDVGSVLVRRLRCRPNIYPTLCRRLVLAGYVYKCIILYCYYYYFYFYYTYSIIVFCLRWPPR